VLEYSLNLFLYAYIIYHLIIFNIVPDFEPIQFAFDKYLN